MEGKQGKGSTTSLKQYLAEAPWGVIWLFVALAGIIGYVMAQYVPILISFVWAFCYFKLAITAKAEAKARSEQKNPED